MKRIAQSKDHKADRIHCTKYERTDSAIEQDLLSQKTWPFEWGHFVLNWVKLTENPLALKASEKTNHNFGFAASA